MRKTISLVMFLAISMVSMDVMAQRLTDSGYRTVGYIKQGSRILHIGQSDTSKATAPSRTPPTGRSDMSKETARSRILPTGQ